MEKKVDQNIHKIAENIIIGGTLAVYFAAVYVGAIAMSYVEIIASSFLLAILLQNTFEKGTNMQKEKDGEHDSK